MIATEFNTLVKYVVALPPNFRTQDTVVRQSYGLQVLPSSSLLLRRNVSFFKRAGIFGIPESSVIKYQTFLPALCFVQTEKHPNQLSLKMHLNFLTVLDKVQKN